MTLGSPLPASLLIRLTFTFPALLAPRPQASILRTLRPSLYSNDHNSGLHNKRAALVKTLSLSEVKTRLPELVAGVQEREEEVIVTKNGLPAAILINIDEYTRLKETLDVLSDPGLMNQIAESRAFYKTKRNGLSFEDVFGEPLRPTKKRRTA